MLSVTILIIFLRTITQKIFLAPASRTQKLRPMHLDHIPQNRHYLLQTGWPSQKRAADTSYLPWAVATVLPHEITLLETVLLGLLLVILAVCEPLRKPGRLPRQVVMCGL